MGNPGQKFLDQKAASVTGSSFSPIDAQPTGGNSLDAVYVVENNNWYKSLPYGFVSWDRKHQGGESGSAGGRVTMFLPISPENLNVTTHFATNIITTLYGIIEEHSEPRFYDITISGTTGFAPRFVAPSVVVSNADATDGRGTFEPAFQVNLGGFFQKQVGTINSIIDNVNSIAETKSGKPNPSGISPENSGYAAFHNLYRFLMNYKRDTSGAKPETAAYKRSAHPLQFLNYKDGIKYDVVPVSFTMVRNAANPMMYNYSIQMRGFNLRNVTANQSAADPLAALGLGTSGEPLNGTSGFADAQSITGAAANIMSAGLSF